jgi:hypothetical protein
LISAGSWTIEHVAESTHRALAVRGSSRAWLSSRLGGGRLASGAQEFTSLAGVAYPARAAGQAAWQPLSINDGVQGNPTRTANEPSYYVQDGVVYLSGQINENAGGNCGVPVLPPAARPTSTLYLNAEWDHSNEGIMISPSGMICVTNAGTFASLDGISYQASS